MFGLAVACLVVLAPQAYAVMCDSFQTEAACEGQATAEGICGWRGSACREVAPLGEGMVGMTSIVDAVVDIDPVKARPLLDLVTDGETEADLASAPAPEPGESM